MMGSSHAISGASLWLAGWAWTAGAGLAEPDLDVLTVGTMLVAGAALLPDFDHPRSRIARSGGIITVGIAWLFGRLGRTVHHLTKLDADRPDKDGHRTITHTFVFAAAIGVAVHFACAGRYGKWIAAVLVWLFVKLGYAAIRSHFGGRRRRVKGWHKHNLAAVAAAFATVLLVPANAWWIGLAVGAGCAIHCLGDAATALGCPVLWPIPIPSTRLRYDRKTRTRVPVREWRTWHLVGTPQWMRFGVNSPRERLVAWSLVMLGVMSMAGIVWSGGWGPNSLG